MGICVGSHVAECDFVRVAVVKNGNNYIVGEFSV